MDGRDRGEMGAYGGRAAGGDGSGGRMRWVGRQEEMGRAAG